MAVRSSWSVCGEKIRRVIAQHQRRARRPSTPSLHLNKIYSTFTLWPTGARDRVVVEVLVDSLLGLLHQPTLASPVPTIRSVPHLLRLLVGCEYFLLLVGGKSFLILMGCEYFLLFVGNKVQKDGKPNGSSLAVPCTVEDIPRQ